MSPKRKSNGMTSTPLTPLSEEDRNAQVAEQRAYLMDAPGIIVDNDVQSSPIAQKVKRTKKAASATTSAVPEGVYEISDIPGDVIAKENATQGIATPAITPETANSPASAPAVNSLIGSAATALAQDGAAEKPNKAPRKRKVAASSAKHALATEAGCDERAPRSPKEVTTRKRKAAAAYTNTSLENNDDTTTNAISAATKEPTKRKEATPKKTPAKKIKDTILPDNVETLLADTNAWFAPPPLTKSIEAKVRTLCDFLDDCAVLSIPRLADKAHLAIVSETEIIAALTLLRVHYELPTCFIAPTLDDVAEMIVERDGKGWITLDFERTCADEREIQEKLAHRGLELENTNTLEMEMEMLARQRGHLVAIKQSSVGFRSLDWMMKVSQDKYDPKWTPEEDEGELTVELKTVYGDAEVAASVVEV